MVLAGNISTELGIKTPTSRFFKLFESELHEMQNICERVHETKLHEGDEWHVTDSIKHWTYVVDGEVHTCYENLEEVDEQNKKLTYKLYDGDIGKHYKDFKLIIQLIDKSDGSGAIKWTIEYEKLNEDIHPPNGWMDYVNQLTRDLDAHLVKEAPK